MGIDRSETRRPADERPSLPVDPRHLSDPIHLDRRGGDHHAATHVCHSHSLMSNYKYKYKYKYEYQHDYTFVEQRNASDGDRVRVYCRNQFDFRGHDDGYNAEAR